MATILQSLFETQQVTSSDRGRYSVRSAGDGIVEIVDKSGLVHTRLTIHDGILTAASDHPIEITRGGRKSRTPALSRHRSPIVVDDLPFRVTSSDFSIRIQYDPHRLPDALDLLQSMSRFLTYLQAVPVLIVMGAMLFLLGIVGLTLTDGTATTIESSIDAVLERMQDNDAGDRS